MKTENLAGLLSLVCAAVAMPAVPNPSGSVSQLMANYIVMVVALYAVFWGIGKVLGGWDDLSEPPQ